MKKLNARERAIKKSYRDAYYNRCEHCGGNLDPGEKCDCQAEKDSREASNDCKPYSAPEAHYIRNNAI